MTASTLRRRGVIRDGHDVVVLLSGNVGGGPGARQNDSAVRQLDAPDTRVGERDRVAILPATAGG